VSFVRPNSTQLVSNASVLRRTRSHDQSQRAEERQWKVAYEIVLQTVQTKVRTKTFVEPRYRLLESINRHRSQVPHRILSRELTPTNVRRYVSDHSKRSIGRTE